MTPSPSSSLPPPTSKPASGPAEVSLATKGSPPLKANEDDDDDDDNDESTLILPMYQSPVHSKTTITTTATIQRVSLLDRVHACFDRIDLEMHHLNMELWAGMVPDDDDEETILTMMNPGTTTNRRRRHVPNILPYFCCLVALWVFLISVIVVLAIYYIVRRCTI